MYVCMCKLFTHSAERFFHSHCFKQKTDYLGSFESAVLKLLIDVDLCKQLRSAKNINPFFFPIWKCNFTVFNCQNACTKKVCNLTRFHLFPLLVTVVQYWGVDGLPFPPLHIWNHHTRASSKPLSAHCFCHDSHRKTICDWFSLCNCSLPWYLLSMLINL